MSRSWTLGTLLVAATLGGSFVVVSADGNDEGKGPNVMEGEKETAKDEGVDAIGLAGQLAAWGRANKHAGALAMAARLVGSVQTIDMDMTKVKVEEGKPKAAAADAGAKPHAVTAESLLSEAKTLCGGDAKAQEAVDAIYAMGVRSRGNVCGASAYVGCVEAGKQDVFWASYEGHQWADIALVGDGSSDLDLYVYDESGNLIRCDTDTSDSCLVHFMPAWTARFQVVVKNKGDSSDTYTLYTN